MTTTHVNSLLDVYIGADTGINDTFSQRGNPSGGTSALLGFGLNNMMDGKLTILALSHVGPADAELRTTQPNGSALGASHHGKYINDVTATYKPDDVWTWVTEVNYTRDDLLNNKAFGIAQYGTYAVNSWLSVTGRGEIFADPNNAYVTNFRGNGDFVDSERGTTQQYSTLSPNTTGKGANYVALTLGASIKLPDAPALIDGAMLRPEIRWDHTMNGANAFNYDNTGVARDAGQLSIGMDMIVPLNF